MAIKPVSRKTLLGRARDFIDDFAAATPARFAIIIFAIFRAGFLPWSSSRQQPA